MDRIKRTEGVGRSTETVAEAVKGAEGAREAEGAGVINETPFRQTVSAPLPTSRDITPASALTPACISASAFRSPLPSALGSPLAPTAPDLPLFSTRFPLVPCWCAT